MDRDNRSASTWEYIDFELEVRESDPRKPRKYPVAVRSTTGNKAQGKMRFPFDERELENKLQTLEKAILHPGTRRRRIRRPQEEQVVRDFGQKLFEALLAGEARKCYEESQRQAWQQSKGLRLKLLIRPPELAHLPWEFLYDSGRRKYLCSRTRTPIVRYPDSPEPIDQRSVKPPLRILGMVASPLDLDPLDIKEEKRLVEEAIKDLQVQERVYLEWLEGQTWSDLQQKLWNGPWHIFHFIGHGDFDQIGEEGRIALADKMGNKQLLRASQLAALLDDHPYLRLVFLNSCEGARGSKGDPFSSTAATIAGGGVSAVLAMQYEITDDAAVAFSRTFYRAVANNLPVDASVAEARKAVSMDDTLEWGTPVLYMRSSDGRIFDISTEDRGVGDEIGGMPPPGLPNEPPAGLPDGPPAGLPD